jgi:hypothetical protein
MEDNKRRALENYQKNFWKNIMLEMAENASEKMVLNKTAREKILGNKKWFLRDFLDVIAKNSKVDDNFILYSSFKFTVPTDYKHNRQLSRFSLLANNKNGEEIKKEITDVNYRKATQRLMPGKEYGARIFNVSDGNYVNFGQCLDFIKRQKSILVGAQGLSLVFQLKKEYFPNGMSVFSFDEEETLCSSGRGKSKYYFLPFIHCAGREWSFGSAESVYGHDSGHGLLCVCELENLY